MLGFGHTYDSPVIHTKIAEIDGNMVLTQAEKTYWTTRIAQSNSKPFLLAGSYAELFFIGSNMGVFNMICAICDNKNADKKVLEKAQELLKYEENYAIEVKHFFC